jgi:hypothetical protein
VEQARGFQQSLEAYVEDCLGSSSCPLKAPKEAALGQIHDLLASIAAKPMDTGQARKLTGPLALNGVALAMYDEGYWSWLTLALEDALGGDGAELLNLSDGYLGRGDNGYESNTMPAFLAISCLDSRSPADLASVQAHAEALKEATPTLGEFWGYGEKLCDLWPYPATGEPHRVSAPGAAPIVVIGTTGDPATPYEWAESLADQLESGVLITYKGEGHTAYGRSNTCVGDAVDAFLLDGTPPKDGLTC